MAEVAKHSAAKEDPHAGGHSTRPYWVVWFILLCFTALTVSTGRMDLGEMNIFLAMTIATIKATLVVLFFMHLKDAGGANRLVFCVSIVFMIVMMLGVFGDLLTRAGMTLPSGAPSTMGPEIIVKQPGH